VTDLDRVESYLHAGQLDDSVGALVAEAYKEVGPGTR
jgi:hypothetical protein